ncbi:MAG TPA: hypothetical protein VGJ41_12955 [Nocardioides sp.]
MTKLPDRPFHRNELPTLGITPRQLRGYLAAELVRRVLPAAYARSDLPDTIPLRAEAAALVLPRHSVICDRTAAWLHGIECFDLAELETIPPLDVVSIDGNDRVRRNGTFGGKRTLTSDDICDVDGVPVTTPLRTAADLACLRGRRQAFAVLEAYMRQYGLTRKDLDGILPRFKGRRGVVQLRELASFASPDSESMAESWTKLDIRDEGLPAPVQQYWLALEGYGNIRLDFAYPHLKIAIEYDGEEFHTLEHHRRADEARREALRAAGWVVIVVRKNDFKRDTSEAWLRELRFAIAERTPRPKRVYARGDSLGPRRTRRTR